ncbi:MAG TPA: hypothetical protein VFW40_03875 [Capsulimonadaceae bacterium]|nr:hypothetical protein [Capsulimonadaceae bacterium]
MNAFAKGRPILIGLALGVVLALVIAPQTGWLARYQLGSVLFIRPIHLGIGLRDEPPTGVIYGPIAQRYPNDYPIQLAYTWMNADARRQLGQWDNSAQVGDSRIAALRGLESRFGDNPSLYANILRFSTMDELRTGNRPEDMLLEGQKPIIYPHEEKSSPQVLAAYDQDAATGERLEPENAYFPLMRAIGLFAQDKDEEAISEVLRAGSDTKFDDYCPDQIEGEWKLNEEVIGGKLALPRLAIAAALLFPHYAKMREVARIAAYKAILLEQAGQTEKGLAIRNALMRTGSLMRVQSHSIIGSLVGIAITAIGMDRPGGGPYIKASPNEMGDDVEHDHVKRFCDYLTRIGHADEVPWVSAESAAGQRVRGLIRQAAADTFLNGAIRSGLWSAVDMLALGCACWLMLLALAGNLLSRTKRIQAGEPLPLADRWGVYCASILLGIAVVYIIANLLSSAASAVFTWFITALVLAAYIACVVRSFRISLGRGLAALLVVPVAGLILYAGFFAWPAQNIYVMSIVCAAVPVLLVWLLIPERPRSPEAQTSKKRAFRLPSKREVWRGLGACAVTLVIAALAIGFAALQMRSATDVFVAAGALGWGSPANYAWKQVSLPIIVAVTALLALLALPAVAGLIVVWIRRTPVSLMLTYAYRLAGVPLACLILIVYGWLLLITLRVERAANYVEEHTVHGEGPYYALLANEPWVGKVAERLPGD